MNGRGVPEPVDWQAFSVDVFGDSYLVWHDGPDFVQLEQRWHADPDLVRVMLFAGIAGSDPTAASAIEFLARQGEDIPGAIDYLRLALASSAGTFSVRVAEALFALTRDQDLAQPIRAVLVQGQFWVSDSTPRSLSTHSNQHAKR